MAARNVCSVRYRLRRCDKEAAINCHVSGPGHRGAYRYNTSGASARYDRRRDAWQVSRCEDYIPLVRLAWNMPPPLSRCLQSEPCPVPLGRERVVLIYPGNTRSNMATAKGTVQFDSADISQHYH